MLYFLGLHYIADFLLQSREMGKKTSESFKWLMGHLAIQFLVFFFGGFVWFRLLYADSTATLLYFAAFLALLNAIVHGLIDSTVWRLYKMSVYGRTKHDKNFDASKWEYWNDSKFYHIIGLDQLLHTITVYMLYGQY
jgi:hypothetical protein